MPQVPLRLERQPDLCVPARQGLERLRRLGADAAAALEGVEVYHAGTTLNDDGSVVTSGGRVLTMVGCGADYKAAIARAYAGVDRIKFEGAYSRRDIGKKALK